MSCSSNQFCTWESDNRVKVKGSNGQAVFCDWAFQHPDPDNELSFFVGMEKMKIWDWHDNFKQMPQALVQNLLSSDRFYHSHWNVKEIYPSITQWPNLSMSTKNLPSWCSTFFQSLFTMLKRHLSSSFISRSEIWLIRARKVLIR